jgi:hypothetical protein
VEIDSGASGRCRGVHGGREVTQPIYVRSTLESGKPFSVRIRAYREVTEDGFTFNRQIAEGSFTWPVAP